MLTLLNASLPKARMNINWLNRRAVSLSVAFSLALGFSVAPFSVPAAVCAQTTGSAATITDITPAIEEESSDAGEAQKVSSAQATKASADTAKANSEITKASSEITKPTSAAGAKTGASSAKDVDGKLLKGSATKDVDRSPILDGVVQTIPPGVDVNLTLNCFLNSELTQIGDELCARVSVDVKDGSKVMLPEGWYIRGLVTDSAGRKRHSRDGYIEVTFDKLISPDGDIELQFPAKFSTKDSTLKSVAKVAMIDTAMVTKGAIKGGLLGLKYGGIPAAVASYGIVPGSTAAAGAAWYGYKALRRQGEIRNFAPGEVIKLKTAGPISLPGFNVRALPSYQKAPPLRGAVINVNKCWFMPDERDKKAQLLKVDFTFVNETKRTYSFRDFIVTTNLGQLYYPEFASPSNYTQMKKTIPPNMQQRGIVTFNVDKGKGEYYLILIDDSRRELSRALIK